MTLYPRRQCRFPNFQGTARDDVGFRLCERYATTAELEDLAVGACRASAQMRVQYLDAVSRAIREMT